MLDNQLVFRRDVFILQLPVLRYTINSYEFYDLYLNSKKRSESETIRSVKNQELHFSWDSFTVEKSHHYSSISVIYLTDRLLDSRWDRKSQKTDKIEISIVVGDRYTSATIHHDKLTLGSAENRYSTFSPVSLILTTNHKGWKYIQIRNTHEGHSSSQNVHVISLNSNIVRIKRRLHVRRAIPQIPKRESLIFLPTPLHHPLLKEGESPHQIVLPVGKLSLISSFATTLITHFTPVPASSRWRQRQVSLEMLYSLKGVASFSPVVLILLLLFSFPSSL